LAAGLSATLPFRTTAPVRGSAVPVKVVRYDELQLCWAVPPEQEMERELEPEPDRSPVTIQGSLGLAPGVSVIVMLPRVSGIAEKLQSKFCSVTRMVPRNSTAAAAGPVTVIACRAVVLQAVPLQTCRVTSRVPAMKVVVNVGPDPLAGFPLVAVHE